MIYALSLASNLNADQHISWAIQQLSHVGVLKISQFFEIPCRHGVGENYLNGACLLNAFSYSINELLDFIKDLEHQTGRIRPSHCITLDIDLIAWQDVHKVWHFNQKKWPLTFDVKLPLSELIEHPDIAIHTNECSNYSIKPIAHCDII